MKPHFLGYYAMPLWLFWLIYGITCLMGAIPFYLGYYPYQLLVRYFAGISVPSQFTPIQHQNLFLIFILAPLVFSLSYLAVGWWRPKFPKPPEAHEDNARLANTDYAKAWLLVFSVLSLVGYASVYRGGSFDKIATWLDFSQWIESRLHLLATLHFFEMVNLYMLVPISAAGLLLSYHPRRWPAQMAKLLPLGIVASQQLLLFQKKALLFAFIMIFASLLIDLYGRYGLNRRLKNLSILAVLGLAVAYFIMVVTPVFNSVQKSLNNPANQAASLDTETPRQKELREIKALLNDNGNGKGASYRLLLAYSLLAPITRTSAPAIYYITTYPDQHPFYGLDWGGAALGFGTYPDDDKVVWHAMYPNLDGGTMNAPFQFLLYSQIGAIPTLIACGVLGAMLGLLWQVINQPTRPRHWRSLMGGSLCLLMIYFALDGARLSLIGNIGVVWAWALVMIIYSVTAKGVAARGRIT